MTKKPVTSKPLISCVTPTIGRPILIKTLESLLATTRAAGMEYIVAGKIPEGDVLNRLREMMEEHPQIRHAPVAYERGDASEKRNAGFRESQADIISFLDDDLYVPPEWPEKILEAFSDPAVGMVSGPALVPDDIPLPARLAGMALSSKATGYVAGRYLQGGGKIKKVKWSRTIGCNMSFRRTVFEEITGFSPDFYPGEEMIAASSVARRGHDLVFHPAAYVYHYPRQTFKGFWVQIFKYGATRIRLMRAGLDTEWETLLPGVWVLSLLALGIGAFFWKWCLWLLLLDLAAYAVFDLLITLHSVWETRQPRDLLLFLVLPYMHLSYGIAEWVECFRPNKDLSDKVDGSEVR